MTNNSRARKKRWRLALIFGPVVILACCLLVLDAARSLLADIHRAVFAILEVMIEWANPAMAKPDAPQVQP